MSLTLVSVAIEQRTIVTSLVRPAPIYWSTSMPTTNRYSLVMRHSRWVSCSFDRCVGIDVPNYELSADLQRILDDDLLLLQQQIESVKLEQLHNDLKSVCEHMEKQQPLHRASIIPFFAGPNAPSGKTFDIYPPSINIPVRYVQIPNWSNQFSTRHCAFSKPMRPEFSRSKRINCFKR